MIKQVSVKNFKSIRELDLACRRVNVFIGEPDSGKSNLLEAIGLFSYAYYGAYSGSNDLTPFARLTGLEDLFYDRLADKTLSVACDDNSINLLYKNGSLDCGVLPGRSAWGIWADRPAGAT